MEDNFWHECLKNNQIGFHLPAVNPLLVQHFSSLSVSSQARIFVPLCGKSSDISWLLDRGFSVVGVELSVLAINQLFDELKITPAITTRGAITRYKGPKIDILVGDIFKVSQFDLGSVSATYDRAALVALPAEMRRMYSEHVIDITNAAPQLLLTFSYDQKLVDGPPFSISKDEVFSHYSGHYDCELLQEKAVAGGGLKGTVPAADNVWLLK